MWIKNKNWLNGKSFITNDELFGEQIHIIRKISKVLFTDEYFDDTKDFCRSILEFAIDHEYITWKQANAVMDIKTTEERRRLYHSSPKNKYIYMNPKSQSSDYEKDILTRRLFGECVFQEELEGYKVEYSKDGSRYFTLPTGNERLEDYI